MNMPALRSSALSHRTGSSVANSSKTNTAGKSGISDQASQHYESAATQSLENSVQQRAQENPQAFRNALEQAYGGKADPATLDKMTSMAANGNLPMPENVVFVDAGTLPPGSKGAYDAANGGTITWTEAC